jgi:inner membrane protein
MTGRQHVTIGIGTALPTGVLLAVQPPPGLVLAPGWLAVSSWRLTGLLVVVLVVAGGLLGALLPDLDTDHSMLEAAPRVWRRRLQRRGWLAARIILTPLLVILGIGLSLINWLVMLVADHRGVTHSLTALAAVTLLGWVSTAWALGPSPAIGLALGYASHLATDALTPRGVELAAPWSRRRWYLLPRPLRFGADSWRAGCLVGIVFVAGTAIATWQVWGIVQALWW